LVKSNNFDIGSDDAKVDEHGQWKLNPGWLPGWDTKIKDWLSEIIPDIEEGDAEVVKWLKENLDEPIPEVHENIWEEPNELPEETPETVSEVWSDKNAKEPVVDWHEECEKSPADLPDEITDEPVDCDHKVNGPEEEIPKSISKVNPPNM
jgi:hypothetical protein